MSNHGLQSRFAVNRNKIENLLIFIKCSVVCTAETTSNQTKLEGYIVYTRQTCSADEIVNETKKRYEILPF
jgi:hypothetical protein